MTEENDDIWADDESEAESEESGWMPDDPAFDYGGTFQWEDSQGAYHEVHYEPIEEGDAERRAGFDTFDEARDYINEILTGADQYFDVYWDEDEGVYAVWYMGGSE